VLVIDDDRVALTVLCSMLRGAGADVEGTADGVEALQRLQDTRFDFVLCDVYMPGLDGFEVVRRLRQLAPPERAAVPAVAITAHPSYENLRDAQRAGFQDVVGKPVEITTLIELVLRLARPDPA